MSRYHLLREDGLAAPRHAWLSRLPTAETLRIAAGALSGAQKRFAIPGHGSTLLDSFPAREWPSRREGSPGRPPPKGTDDRPLEWASAAVWIPAVRLSYSWRMERLRRNETTRPDHASPASEASAGSGEEILSTRPPERRSGRPLKYSPHLALQIAKQYARGDVTLTEVLAAHGVSRSAGWRWRKRYPYFRMALAIANRERAYWEDIMGKRVFPRVSTRKPRTFRRRRKRGPPSTYSPEKIRIIAPGLRATARANGIAVSTLRGWAEQHFGELGVLILRERVRLRIARLELITNRLEERYQGTLWVEAFSNPAR